MKELNQRNTETVEQVLKEMTHHIEAQEIRINNLNTALSSMSMRMTELERLIVLQKVQTMGHGASIL